MRAQTIILNRAKVQQLVDLCVKHKLDSWVVAKNEGAYVGAFAGPQPEQQRLFFFNGCDPKKDEWWNVTAHAKFGDDFEDRMDTDVLKEALAKKEMTSVKVKVNSKKIEVTF
jgi:hypothetical protein